MQKTHTRITVFSLVLMLLSGVCLGQKGSFTKPRKERLLNDLSVLIWDQPSADKVSVNLRIHSGSAFDPQDKEGVTLLLTEAMFPDTGVYEDFKDEIGGSLLVSSNYDFIQIEMTAKPDKLVTVLEILATALVNPVIDIDSTEAAKKRITERYFAAGENAKMVADFEAANRLYGDFPYGRNRIGTEESFANIDFADLIFAKQRFLTADNATLSITGNLDTGATYRAARRLLGAWQKGNGRVPANFTLPERIDTIPLTVNTDTGTEIEVRFAVEAGSRTSDDYWSAKLLSRVYAKRTEKTGDGNFHYFPYLLKGYFLYGSSYLSRTNTAEGGSDTPPVIKKTENPMAVLFSGQVTEEEFQSAKSAELLSYKNATPSDLWFDVDTYRLKSVEAELEKLNKTSLAGLNALAAKLSKNRIAEVIVMPLDAAEPMNDKDPNDPR